VYEIRLSCNPHGHKNINALVIHQQVREIVLLYHCGPARHDLCHHQYYDNWDINDNYYLQLLSAFHLSSHFAMFHIIGKILLLFSLARTLNIYWFHLHSHNHCNSLLLPLLLIYLSLSSIVDC
jgi:hypothetical protein